MPFLITESTTEAELAERRVKVDTLTESPFQRGNRLLKILQAAGPVNEYDLTCLAALHLALSQFAKLPVSKRGVSGPLCQAEADDIVQSLIWYHYYTVDWEKLPHLHTDSHHHDHGL